MTSIKINCIMFSVYEEAVHIKSNNGSGSLSFPMPYGDACKRAYETIQSFGFKNVQLDDDMFVGKRNGWQYIVIVSDKHSVDYFDKLDRVYK